MLPGTLAWLTAVAVDGLDLETEVWALEPAISTEVPAVCGRDILAVAGRDNIGGRLLNPVPGLLAKISRRLAETARLFTAVPGLDTSGSSLGSGMISGSRVVFGSSFKSLREDMPVCGGAFYKLSTTKSSRWLSDV